MTWLSIAGFALKYWKNIVPAIVGITIGFGIAWWIQGAKVDRADARLQRKETEVAKLMNDLKKCQDANASNGRTIKALKAEVKDATNLCVSRLKVKDSVIDRLRDIQDLKPSQEVKDEKGNVIVGGDAILHKLNSMFDNASPDNKN